MRIGILGDTHNNAEGLKKALEALKFVDVLIHLGDHDKDIMSSDHGIKEVYCVRGNTDIGSESPEELLLEFENRRFLICHGHRYRVKTELQSLYYRAREVQAEVVLFGHTHQALLCWEEDILFLNPGSPSKPWPGQKPSVAVLEIGSETLDPQLVKL